MVANGKETQELYKRNHANRMGEATLRCSVLYIFVNNRHGVSKTTWRVTEDLPRRPEFKSRFKHWLIFNITEPQSDFTSGFHRCQFTQGLKIATQKNVFCTYNSISATYIKLLSFIPGSVCTVIGGITGQF